MALITPTRPRRAETRLCPSFVLGSKQSSTYPRGYVSGCFSPVALLDSHFEHRESRVF